MSPELIGRYVILAELGRGGMATVYRAHDPQLGREVAVKILPRELLHDPEFRARFQREVAVVAALEHPAIVPVYGSGEHEGQPYMVMRLMTGGTLAARLAGGPLPLHQAARLVGELAPALDAAHGAGLIHRDVKPDNILFDGEGRPYLADFGIVGLADATTRFTRSGVIGTPDYMAPELTKPGGLTPGVDVYALGVLLFQMLAGRLPYTADTPLGTLVAHVTEPVPDLLALRPELPPATQLVLARALAKEPATRYQSAGALGADLAALAAGEAPRTIRLARPQSAPGPARPPAPPVPRPARSFHPSERSFQLKALGVALAALVVFGSLLMFIGRGRSIPSAPTPIFLPTRMPLAGVYPAPTAMAQVIYPGPAMAVTGTLPVATAAPPPASTASGYAGPGPTVYPLSPPYPAPVAAPPDWPTLAVGAFGPLSRQIVQAAYSATHDKLLLTLSAPPQLAIYQAPDWQLKYFDLEDEAAALAVSPDGELAAVSYGRRVMLLDLRDGNPVQVVEVQEDLATLAVDDDRRVYYLPSEPGQPLRVLNFDPVAPYSFQVPESPRSPASLKLAAGGKLYSVTTGSPSIATVYTLEAGALRLSPELPAVDVCGGVWPSPDGLRVVTGCGQVLVSQHNGLPLERTWQLAASPRLGDLVYSPDGGPVLALTAPKPAGEFPGQGWPPLEVVNLYEPSSFGQAGSVALQALARAGKDQDTYLQLVPRWIFVSRDGSNYYVVARDPDLALDGISVISAGRSGQPDLVRPPSPLYEPMPTPP